MKYPVMALVVAMVTVLGGASTFAAKSGRLRSGIAPAEQGAPENTLPADWRFKCARFSMRPEGLTCREPKIGKNLIQYPKDPSTFNAICNTMVQELRGLGYLKDQGGSALVGVKVSAESVPMTSTKLADHILVSAAPSGEQAQFDNRVKTTEGLLHTINNVVWSFLSNEAGLPTEDLLRADPEFNILSSISCRWESKP